MEARQEYLSVAFDQSLIKERNRQLAILLDIGQFLTSSLKLPALLDEVLSRVLRHFSFDAGRIYLMHEGGAELNLAACRGMDPDGLETVKIGEGFSGKTALTRSLLVRKVTDLEDKKRVRLLLGKGYRMIVCVPLITRNEVVGVMNLATDRVIELDPHKIDLLMVVGNQIAHAASNVRLVDEIERQMEEIREKKETIKFFAYSASHDLKSPAVGLNGLVERFFKQYAHTLDEKGQRTCEQILLTSRHIVGLTERLNAYIVSKEAPMRVEILPLEEVCDLVRMEFYSKLEERGVRWIQPDALPGIAADRLSLVRFFQNCVDNALKYGGDVLQEVHIGYQEDPDFHILSVGDDGVGMTLEEADKVFDPFQRQETSRGTDGAGLGMAIVKEIASRHKGKVWVETAKGKGTTFFLSIAKALPLDPCAAEQRGL